MCSRPEKSIVDSTDFLPRRLASFDLPNQRGFVRSRVLGAASPSHQAMYRVSRFFIADPREEPVHHSILLAFQHVLEHTAVDSIEILQIVTHFTRLYLPPSLPKPLLSPLLDLLTSLSLDGSLDPLPLLDLVKPVLRFDDSSLHAVALDFIASAATRKGVPCFDPLSA